MLREAYLPMYGKGTSYTAKSTAGITNFGLTVDNEMTSRLGADARMMLHSGALDGGASMFIRGLNSITADAQPLIVVDGIELDMQRDRVTLHDGQFYNVLSTISRRCRESHRVKERHCPLWCPWCQRRYPHRDQARTLHGHTHRCQRVGGLDFCAHAA